MTLLEIKKLDFSYGDQSILAGIELDLHQGELISLIGSSGCGKTTLLRIIAGFEKPQAGHVLIHGQEVASSHSMTPAEEREIGVVFQNYALFPHLSVKENILFGCHKLSKEKQTKHLETLSELLKIKDHLDKMPHQLSGGQQQRVAIARTIAPQPRLILFDEPFSNLDTPLKLDLAREIRMLVKQFNLSAILVTHDIQDSLSISDRIAIMQNGNILQYTTPESLYQSPSQIEVAQFIQPGQLIHLSHSQANLSHAQLGSLICPRGPQKLNILWLKDSDLEFKKMGHEVTVEEIIFQGETSLLRCVDDQGHPWRVKIYNSHQLPQKIKAVQIGDKALIGFKDGLFVF